MTPEQYGLLDTVLKTIIAVAAVIGAFLAWRAKKAVQEVSVHLDGRLTQLLERTASSSRAEGRDSMRTGDGRDAGAGSVGPAGPAGIQGPVGPQGQVGPQGISGEHTSA